MDLAVKLSINGVDHGINHFDGRMFSDAYYSIANEFGDDFHGDMCQRIAALILNGHHQGGFLLGSQNDAVDFYAFDDWEVSR